MKKFNKMRQYNDEGFQSFSMIALENIDAENADRYWEDTESPELIDA